METKMIALVDLDGVLCDFLSSVCLVHGTTPQELFKTWEPGEFDCALPLGVDDDTFWENINVDPFFWHGMDWMPDGREILKAVESRVGKDYTFLLSSPSRSPTAWSGKAWWVQKHIPEYRKKLILTESKHAVAGPKKVLIDDRDDNVKSFREAGGDAILLPRRWNSGHKILTHSKPVEWLEMLLVERQEP